MVKLGVMFRFRGMFKYLDNSGEPSCQEKDVIYRFPVFLDEDVFKDVVYEMLVRQGYSVIREFRSGRGHRFDFRAERGGEVLVVEAKNPKTGTNKVAGEALNQIASYLYSYPSLHARGWLVLGRPVTSHVLKYKPARMCEDYYKRKDLRKRLRIGVGFPIVDDENLYLYVVEREATWAKGRAQASIPRSELPEGVKIEEVCLSQAQFFDLIFYNLWLQNKHEWRGIGLDTPFVSLLENEANRRGYTILENGSVKEPWYLTH